MKYKFMDPEVIMSVVVALIILAVGIFAFFVTVQNIPTSTPTGGNSTGVTTTLENRTYYSIMNASETGESVFNIVGIVLIIGAIMTIIGLVYSYMRPRY